MPTGKQLRDARKKMNLSAERVAERVGVSVNTIYAWESDTSEPSDPKIATKLHRVLGFPIRTAKEVKKARKARAPRPTKLRVEQLTVQTNIKNFFNLLAFFVKDQARRSTTLELLRFAEGHGLTLHNLIEMLDAQTPAQLRG